MKKVIELILELKNKGIFIEDHFEQLKVTGELHLLTELDKDRIKSLKDQIKAFLIDHKNNSYNWSPIQVAENQDSYPLSSSQQRLWILSQFEETSLAYNISGTFLFKGKLDKEILETSFKTVIDRHEILRTVFKPNAAGEINQVVVSLNEIEFKIQSEDLRDRQNEGETINDCLKKVREIRFNLETGPLLRLTVLQIEEDQWVFTFVMHHIISDGWSIEVLTKELISDYNSLYKGVTTKAEPLRIQYKDYSKWQQEELRGDKLKAGKSYWLKQLEGTLPVLQLHTDKKRPAIKTYKGNVVQKVISKKILQQLDSISPLSGATTFMKIVTVVNVLLNKYTNNDDIIIGTPVAGREHLDLENQIGVYINMIMLRTKFKVGDSFVGLLENVKNTVLDAYKHQSYPYDLLVEDLKVQRDISRNPIFDFMVVFQNKKNTTMPKLGDADIVEYKNSYDSISKFDMTFSFEENDENLLLQIEYSTDLFYEETILRLANHFEEILKSIIVSPDQNLSKLNYLSADEKETLLIKFNNTKKDYPKNITLLDLFSEHVIGFPSQIAAKVGNKQITYQELNERSNQLAKYLMKMNIGKGMLVPISIKRSIDMLVGLLGVLKSGAAYVPVDPDYPVDRVKYMIENSGAKIMLGHREIITEILLPDILVIDIEQDEELIDKELKTNLLDKQSNSEDLAYVIYTSGSTGKPKGVMVSHNSIVNFIYGMDSAILLDKSDHVLSITSISFDISVLEIFYSLSRGISLTINNKRLNNFDRYLKNDTVKMDFSLFYFSSYKKSENNKYDLLLKSVSYADKNEFKGVWLPERHFHEFGGIFPNPSVLGAALSTITTNIQIRSGSVVLPNHDVLRVAEEWSVVDNLSNGRVSLSIASGWHADDFVLKPQNYEKRQEIMYNQIKDLKSLWKGSSIKRVNGKNNEIEIKVFPRPIQSELPIWITSGGNPETFKSAGKIGAGILTHLLGQEINELEKNIKLYKQTLLENGFPSENAKISLMIHTYIGSDLEKVKDDVKEPFKSYLGSSVDLIKNLAKDLNLDINDVDKQGIDSLLEMAFERYWQTSALLGTLESCAETVEKLYSIGVTELACLIDFGIEDEKVFKSLEYLKKMQDAFKLQDNGLKAEEHPITTLQITPSYLNTLSEDQTSELFFKSLKKLIIGGEKLEKELIKKLPVSSDILIYNMYGPTETTIWSTSKKITKESQITIGKPIQNTNIYILDTNLNLCPIGIPGQLFIGGDGLSNGYLNQKELTDERFIKNPFNSDAKDLIYMTGDIAKWLPDGEIDIVGRIDDQVKFNGFRIELGEIENTLTEFDTISNSIVILKNNNNEHKVLIAYVTGSEKIDTTKARTFLASKLPKYMIPNHIIQLDEIPLTANGKVDKRKLLLYDPSTINEERVKEYVPPNNNYEIELVKIWSEVLGVEESKISINDNFFDLGGSSLSIIKMLNHVNKTFNKKITLVTVFRLPSIEVLSEYISSDNDSENDKHNDEEIEELTSTMENSLNLLNDNND